MRKTFDAELVELSHELTAMGTTTQDAIDLVTASLTQGKAEGAKATIAMRNTMDQMERDIENRCMSLLMRQQPVARDLRTISAAMKMVTDLQRIGDQAALLIAESGDKPDVPEEIVAMSRQAGLMVRQAIAAYVDRDENTARAVINLDDVVDDLFVQLKKILVERIAARADHSDRSVDLIIIGKYLERVADHAVNIANWAIFCVTGEIQ